MPGGAERLVCTAASTLCCEKPIFTANYSRIRRKTPQTLALTRLIFSTLLLCSGRTRADQPGSDWLGIPPLLQKLDAQGFKRAKDLTAVHGHCEGEAFQHEEIPNFHANAQTGQVPFQKAKDNADTAIER